MAIYGNDATRIVYGLVDPRTDKVCYVGVTVDLVVRIKAHLHPRNGLEPVREWVSELNVLQLKPKVRIFGCAPGKLPGSKLEQHWILKFYSEGHPLRNRKVLYYRNIALSKRAKAILNAAKASDKPG